MISLTQRNDQHFVFNLTLSLFLRTGFAVSCLSNCCNRSPTGSNLTQIRAEKLNPGHIQVLQQTHICGFSQVCVCVRSVQKLHEHSERKPKTTTTYGKRKEKALDNTIDFPTMVSESGKLETTMMHGAHKGPTNCSFVLKMLFVLSICAISPSGSRTVTDSV